MLINRWKISKEEQEGLNRLARYTGIKGAHILCRWAFAVSMHMQHPPEPIEIKSDGVLDLDWETFAQEHQEIYLAALKYWCLTNVGSCDPEILKEQLRYHLHRGINVLASENRVTNIVDLLSMAEQEDANIDQHRAP